jgi:hypothetical protein
VGAAKVVGFVVVLGVLGGGAVVADRVAVGVAERRAVDAIEANLEVTGTPTVEIGGFPFLTQLLAGSLDDVTAHASAASLEGVDVTDVDVQAHGVSTSSPYSVADVVVTATLPTATLERLLAEQTGLDLEVGVDGDQLVVGTSFLGLTVEGRVDPRIEAGELRIDVTRVSLAGADLDVAALPGDLPGRLSDLVVPIDGLPDGVALADVAVVPEGARLTATGTDVTYTRPSGG